jgi:transposase
MFLRIVKAQSGGVQREYVRLVESVRGRDGKVKQRLVCSLGRKDLLIEYLPALMRLLQGENGTRQLHLQGDVQSVQAWDWGPVLVARTLFLELGLEKILDGIGPKTRNDGPAFADRVFVLLANRLCCPTSEHGLARWLETDFVCDRQGRRFVPAWRDDTERRKSKRPRVRVESKQLDAWYRTLDQLVTEKSQIERWLFLQLRDLFSLDVELVFYDITSSYFEGRGPAKLAQYGYSRDGKPRNRQIVLGLVLVNGWPVAHHVFAGNRRDSSTVPEVVKDVHERFGIKRMVFVGDRGMMTTKNVDLVREAKQGYIVGLVRRRRPQVQRYLERVTEEWQDCEAGITATERSSPPRTRVQEVAGDEPGVRVFVVHSEEREEYERGQRERAMARVRKMLEALRNRVATGKLKAPEKIGAAAARILARHHGHRYYRWELRAGAFHFEENAERLKEERAYEGKYVIQTEETGLSAVEVVAVYKELSELERSFAVLKDVIELRPIYHQKDERVEAHVFVATLAFLLDRMLEKKLESAGLDLSSREAWQALRSIRLVQFENADGTKTVRVSTGTSRAASILNAAGVRDRCPPEPPDDSQTVM